jgi:hypothetical protein
MMMSSGSLTHANGWQRSFQASMKRWMAARWQSIGGQALEALVSKPLAYQILFGARRLRLDRPFDNPDDPTRSVWIRLDRRGIQREQPRSQRARLSAPGVSQCLRPDRSVGDHSTASG